MPASNNTEGVTLRDAYNRYYVAPAEYACAVTSRNISDAGGVLCGSAPGLYDSIGGVLFSEQAQCGWEFKSAVLTSGQRKLKNLHC
jgi:hypothetical protein